MCSLALLSSLSHSLCAPYTTDFGTFFLPPFLKDCFNKEAIFVFLNRRQATFHSLKEWYTLRQPTQIHQNGLRGQVHLHLMPTPQTGLLPSLVHTNSSQRITATCKNRSLRPRDGQDSCGEVCEAEASPTRFPFPMPTRPLHPMKSQSPLASEALEEITSSRLRGWATQWIGTRSFKQYSSCLRMTNNRNSTNTNG